MHYFNAFDAKHSKKTQQIKKKFHNRVDNTSE